MLLPMSLLATDKTGIKVLRNERILLKTLANLGLTSKSVCPFTPKANVDYNYYLAKQILPPIERLCAPIDCTDSARIAECLGFDPRLFRTNAPLNPTERSIEPLESQISDEERFRDAEQLMLKCPSCSDEHSFSGLVGSKVQIRDTYLISGSRQCCGTRLS